MAADFDLVPSSYRRRRWLRRALVRFGVGYLLVGVALGGAKAALTMRIDAESSEIERLRADKNSVLAQRAAVDELDERRAALETRLRALETLRGGPPVGQVFDAIDRALGADVWFIDWRFLRAGEFVDVEPKTVNRGYMVLVPAGESTDEARGWRLSTHMEIKAQALTHSALAEFVQRLYAEPIVAEVRLLNTRSRRYTTREVVDFELAVLVGGRT